MAAIRETRHRASAISVFFFCTPFKKVHHHPDQKAASVSRNVLQGRTERQIEFLEIQCAQIQLPTLCLYDVAQFGIGFFKVQSKTVYYARRHVLVPQNAFLCDVTESKGDGFCWESQKTVDGMINE
jgi:hypothetical protein